MATIADYGIFNQNANVFDPEALQKVLQRQQMISSVPARTNTNPSLGDFMQIKQQQPADNSIFVEEDQFRDLRDTSPVQLPSVSAQHGQPANASVYQDPFMPQIEDPVEQFLKEIPENSNDTRDRASSFLESVNNIFGKVSDAVVPKAEASRPPQQEMEMDTDTPDLNLQEIFQTAADKYDLDTPTLVAIADQETGHLKGEERIKAVSKNSEGEVVGAKGIMQLMPEIINAYNEPIDPFNPQENIMRGARLFREELDRFGDIELALAAYNAGSPKVLQAIEDSGLSRTNATFDQIKDNLRPETQEYVPSVMDRIRAAANPIDKIKDTVQKNFKGKGDNPKEKPKKGGMDFFLKDAVDPTIIDRKKR